MSRQGIFFGLFCLLFVQVLWAQNKPNDTIIKATTIEITQIYRPQVKQAIKEQYTPSLPNNLSPAPEYDYQVPQPTSTYSYKAQPLQALAYKQDSAKEQYNSYLKLGLGNLQTIYLDGGTRCHLSKDWDLNVGVGFLSQKGTLNYQKQSIGMLRADMVQKGLKWTTKVGLNASHHQSYQYGFDQISFPNRVAPKLHLTGATLAYSLGQNQFGGSGYKIQLDVNSGYYNAANNTDEFSANTNIAVQKKWNSYLLVEGGFTSSLVQTNTLASRFDNNFASLNFGLQYDKNKLFFKAYLKPTIAQNSNTFLLNDLQLKYRFTAIKTHIGLGFQGSLVQNTFRQSYLINPFLSNYTAAQTHSNELYLLLEKAFGHHLSFWARASWWQYENLASFINAPTGNSEYMWRFYIPRANATTVQIGGRYQIAENFSFGGQFTLQQFFNLSNATRAWHLPTNNIMLDLHWLPLENLTVSAYGQYLGGIRAIDASLKEVKLNPFLDMGFGAEYVVRKKLSFFIQCNNLLNFKYERWLGYEAYGINIYGGVRLKF